MSPEEILFNSHEYLAEATIYKMFPNPRGIARKHRIELEDLFQYAATGLWKSCLNFNPKKSKFITHAINNIKWHVTERLNRETSMIRYSCNRVYDPSEMYGIISMDVEINDNPYSHNTYHDVVASDVNIELDIIDIIDEEFILSKLGDKQKEIVKLKEKGLSSNDIAKLWNMTGANVRHHANKAKKQLEDYMEVI